MKPVMLKAGFTIEASVIVPVAMVLTAAVMLISFALHDRVVMHTAAVFEIMDHAKGFEEEPEEAAAKTEELLAKRLIAAKGTQVLVEEEKDNTKVSVNGSISFPGGFLWRVAGSSFERPEARVRISNLDGRKALIGYKTICDGISAFGNAGKEREEGSETDGAE